MIGLGVYMLASPNLGADWLSIVVVDSEDDLLDETELEEFVVEIEPLEETLVSEASLDQPLWDSQQIRMT